MEKSRTRKGLSMNAVLMLAILGTVTAVLVCAMFVFLRTYRQSLFRNAQTNSRRTISQAAGTVEEYLEDINELMALLERSLEADEPDRADFFDTLLAIRPDVVAASTYDRQGSMVNCYSLDARVRQGVGVNLSFDAAQMEKYRDGYVSPPHVVSFFEGYYPWVVTMIAPLNTEGEDAWVALDISCSNISSYINGIGIGQRGYCFLMDETGDIVYHPQQQLIYSSLKSEDTVWIAGLEDGSHVTGTEILTIQTLENGNWRMVGVSYVDELISDSVNEAVRILIPSVLLILILSLLISVIISRTLSRPIHGLAEAMQRFEQDSDSFVYQTTPGMAREARMLTESFHQMVQRIRRLVENARNEEINLRKTELKALQAQINPHFLYNTLDSISWMCEQGKNAEAVRMVNALATLFRISISRGHELISIRSELQHAESYLKIQSYRYKNQFTYEVDARPECLDYLCNKITLQPLLENAIYHGINGLVDEGEIRITVRPDGEDILFTVEDNGNGMDEEQIRAILSKERSDHAGIGIKNVNDRLKIYFGSRYGITIESRPDEGTRVLVRMPKVREEAEYENR